MINYNDETEETLETASSYDDLSTMDTPISYKKQDPIIEHIEADIGPTSTTTIIGETASGALGGLSFDEIIGEDLVGYEEHSNVRDADWLEEDQVERSYKK
ncbi:hypothetical protein [Bacillus sp. 165]|uniref:hypothetical protein n=1 Tax=Bacillus sp. 165 TaxID=1529117 RepID=UPI001ADC69A9|nr:hypothetical protein [Bacillus sp. 165]MBO9128308.1 hypothetical protein [Bacillus sp. 165]